MSREDFDLNLGGGTMGLESQTTQRVPLEDRSDCGE